MLMGAALPMLALARVYDSQPLLILGGLAVLSAALLIRRFGIPS